jgi:uncharacterized protein YaaR (DUF327 family)
MMEQSRRLSQEKKQRAKPGAVNKTGGFRSLLETQARSEFSETGTDIPGIEGLSFDEALVVLKDALEIAGDNLKTDGAMQNSITYKVAVKNFMQFVVSKNYEIESPMGRLQNDGSRKLYFLIKIVDEKLDRLAAEVLSNHADKLALLAKIDEINGLLIDFLS